ncbi:MAG: iron-sulfur cluster assembly accessory protein [candidate division Zixibacteria bacterium]
MSEINTEMQDTIQITPAAIAEVKRLISKQKEDSLMLRVGVQGGGCSGLSYAMSFDDKINQYDRVIEINGLKIVIDQKSLIYMGGTTIDFSNELLTGGFQFENPKSLRGCSCGTSFSV